MKGFNVEGFLKALEESEATTDSDEIFEDLSDEHQEQMKQIKEELGDEFEQAKDKAEAFGKRSITRFEGVTAAEATKEVIEFFFDLDGLAKAAGGDIPIENVEKSKNALLKIVDTCIPIIEVARPGNVSSAVTGATMLLCGLILMVESHQKAEGAHLIEAMTSLSGLIDKALIGLAHDGRYLEGQERLEQLGLEGVKDVETLFKKLKELAPEEQHDELDEILSLLQEPDDDDNDNEAN